MRASETESGSDLRFSFVIPVYNRPEEIRELLDSLTHQSYKDPFEVVVIEDGSKQTSEKVIAQFEGLLNIKYIQKPNTGPGHSRNFGMERASGSYFLILDSDCVLPKEYLNNVSHTLRRNYTDCFGGPDMADPGFKIVQKAVNYALTSFLTTGGVRGHDRGHSKYEPRSFNLGLSKQAFAATGGFGNMHPGEDPEMVWRLRSSGFSIQLIPEAAVIHKRRINLKKFFIQVYKFGSVRPIISKWHPQSARWVYWMPTFFLMGLVLSILTVIFQLGIWSVIFPGIYLLYAAALFTDALIQTRHFGVAVLAVIAVFVQFIGYGWGFIKSTFLITFINKDPQKLFPGLFFKY